MGSGGVRRSAKARAASTFKDGFSWPGTGVGARLYSYLYDVVPPGLRRQQMMRYMLLGFMAEHGIRAGKNDFIPPASAERELVAVIARSVAAPGNRDVATMLSSSIQQPEQPVDAASTEPVSAGQAAVMSVEESVFEVDRAVGRSGSVKPGLFAGFRG